jgi:hypothetical protein
LWLLHPYRPFLYIVQAFSGVTDEFSFDKVHYAVKSSVSMATLAKSRLLTQEGSVKKTMELEFNIQVSSLEMQCFHQYELHVRELVIFLHLVLHP